MRSSALADQIPAVVEQMKFHKKQARRLAELASSVYDAVDSSIPKPPPEDTPEYVRDGLDKLIRFVVSLAQWSFVLIGSQSIISHRGAPSRCWFWESRYSDERTSCCPTRFDGAGG